MYTVTTDQKDVVLKIVENATGKEIVPFTDSYTSVGDYERSGIVPIEPMSAKDSLNDNELDTMLQSPRYIAEEKFDGVRGVFHLNFNSSFNRIFSRRISKQTGWYAENTDSLPHLRDLEIPEELHGTVIDGELIIKGQEFQSCSGILNCLWNEAIKRQSRLGYFSFLAFDIIYYKGVYVAKMPLEKRKALLSKVIAELDSDYVQETQYVQKTVRKVVTQSLYDAYENNEDEFSVKYPDLYSDIEHSSSFFVGSEIVLTKKSWYEYIVFHGGEGLMLKPLNGTYRHTRSREYTKMKKFDTWDVIIVDYEEPTKEYTGKELDTWEYYEGSIPVTKHYYYGWIGTVVYGVLISDEELSEWQKKNPKETPVIYTLNGQKVLKVGDCSGFTEQMRSYITNNKERLLGTIIEVKSQEVLKTGKLRHPRFMRFRPDKEAYQCAYADHMRK